MVKPSRIPIALDRISEQRSIVSSCMLTAAHLVIMAVPFWMKLETSSWSSSLSCRNSGLLSKAGEVDSSHLILRLLGIMCLSLRFEKLSFFFVISLVKVRLMSPRSWIGCVKASCCDRMSGASISRSVWSFRESGVGLKDLSRRDET